MRAHLICRQAERGILALIIIIFPPFLTVFTIEVDATLSYVTTQASHDS